MSASLGDIAYTLKVADSCATSGKSGPIELSLSAQLFVEMSAYTCAIKEMCIRGKNKNSAVLGNADIKVSGTFGDSTNTAHNSDWLRAVARMLDHLADNMDRLPNHAQTIATMVANKMS